MSKYVAGWNMPGYMPEEPFAEFETFEEARAYVFEELERTLDDLYVDEDCPKEAATCEEVLQWVSEQRAPFTTRVVNLYVYEVAESK